MINVEAQAVIASPAERILELVMDPERYKVADRKIHKVKTVERHGNEAVVTMQARIRSLRGPAKQRMILTPGVSIAVSNVPSWQDHLVSFEGSFTCAPHPLGTMVTHAYVFDFRRPLKYPAERFLCRWLDEQIHEEVQILKQLLESGTSSTSAT